MRLGFGCGESQCVPKAFHDQKARASLYKGHEPNAFGCVSGSMDEQPRVDAAPRVEPAGSAETSAGHEGGEVPEERRHLQEVRVQEETAEPAYAEASGEMIEGHGSQGSHVESLRPPDGVDSTAGGQPPQTSSSDIPRADAAAGVQAVSAERRTEDVSQVQRSLNFMTGLLTSLTDRVGRIEQWRSATGSTAGGGAASGGVSSAMTPVTPHAGMLGWADVDRLNQQLSSLHVGEGSERADPGMAERPLASTAKILEGTFSSDSSETARKRAEEAQRAIPGALLGPLALADRPFYLEGDPMVVDQAGSLEPMVPESLVEQTVDAVMRSQALDEGQGASLLPRTTESQSMSSPPGMSGPLGASSLPRTAESQSMSSPPGMSSSMSMWPCVGMSEATRPATMSSTAMSSGAPVSTPPPQRVMDGVLEYQTGVGLGSVCRWMHWNGPFIPRGQGSS